MKALSICSVLAVLLLAVGCADPLEERTPDEVGQQIQRGITGQGRLGPIQRPVDDPAAQHAVPQDHP